MEKAKSISVIDKIKSYFLKEKRFLSSKKEINWIFLKRSLIIGIFVSVIILLSLPETQKDNTEFYSQTHEKLEPTTLNQQTEESNPSLDTWNQMQQSQTTASSALKAVGSYSNYLGGGSSGANYGGSHQDKNYNSSMILSRSGSDSSLTLPAGSVIKLTITSAITVSDTPMPVIGVITEDVLHGSALAISSGSKIYGKATFDESTEKAQIMWESIVAQDNRGRPIQAIAVTSDGQSGVYGNVKSNTYKNITGHMITRFVGAYAEGSMEKSVLGVSTGGAANGLKQAISETARDQANSWGEDLKKEKKWIEIKPQTESRAVITSPFQFRDVGVIY